MSNKLAALPPYLVYHPAVVKNKFRTSEWRNNFSYNLLLFLSLREIKLHVSVVIRQ